jgi:hypothetical protein
MHHRTLGRNVLLPLVLLLVAAVPLAAQTSAPAATEATLAARMQAFLEEVEDFPNTGLVEFFPRRGDWTWFQTLRDFAGTVRGVGVWRFPGAETPRVIGEGGPACESFEGVTGEAAPWEGRLGMQAMRPGRWRRVRGNRFVPPGESARSPVFVEWRREDDAWVVSAVGDEDFHSPWLLGREGGSFRSDTAVVAEDAAFAPEDWYTITIAGRRAPRYGTPRPMARAELTRVGVLSRVSVYVPRESSWETSEVLYLPVSPGRYQPYERPLGRICD